MKKRSSKEETERNRSRESQERKETEEGRKAHINSGRRGGG